MAVLPYLFVYLLPPVTVLGLWLGEGWSFLGLAFAFGGIPIVDALLGLDTHNATEAEAQARAANPWFNVVVRAWLPVQLAVVGYAVWWASQGQSPLAWVGGGLSVGVTAGAAGINIAHELMHRRNRWDRAMAEVLMSTVTYTHFCVEHVFGHHKMVSTPADPAYARAGQTIFGFLPQTIVGSLRSAWRLETRRAKRAKQAGTWRDRRVRYPLDMLAVYGLAFAVGGWTGVVFFAVQSLVAVLLLELINYIEHYGLARRELSPGRYEKVTPQHSWNSAHRLTKFFLFALPRHADHHANAARPYWELRHFDDAPQHPAGYATMVLLSLVPPLWFWVMDRRLADWQAQQVLAEGAAHA
jgi:alkane 1-monooxygenase